MGVALKIQLIVHHELNPDTGAAGSAYQLSRTYRELGHDAAIYSYADLPDSLSPRMKQLVFPLFVAAHLARQVRRAAYDVVDATTGDTWLWSLLDPARRRVVLATSSHGLEHSGTEARLESRREGILHLSWRYPLYYGGLHLREVEATLRRADVVFLVNSVDLEYAVDRLGVDRARARIVPNGIDDFLLGLPLEPTPRDEAPLRIAQIGTYAVQKGVTYGAAALSSIMRAHPRVHVSFLGTAREAEVFADFDPSLHPRIKVVPRYEQRELAALLRGHQIVFSPTLVEGFGRGIVEAMAYGLTPICSAVAGPREYVRDGENGLLVPARDSDALAAALSRLIEDRSLLDHLRRAAQETAQSYSWRAVALARISAYEAVLGGSA